MAYTGQDNTNLCTTNTVTVDWDEYPSGSFQALDQKAKDLQLKIMNNQVSTRMNIPTLVRNDDKYFVISTNGTVETYETEDAAVRCARSVVARDDTAEVVVTKALKYIHIDKPVVVEDIK